MFPREINFSLAYHLVIVLVPAFPGTNPGQASTGEWADCPAWVLHTPVSAHATGPRCECHGPLAEIRCYGLDAVPGFLPSAERVLLCGLYMTRQSISSVERGAFARLRVRKIVLDFNPIGDRIDPEAFSVVDRVLRELHLGACGVQNLPPGLLRNMTQLEYLHLWGNRLDTIPSDYFQGAEKLRELILWGNQLEYLEEGAFSGLRLLRRLDLDHNRINALSKSTFRHLASLEVLHLGRNKIHAISAEDIFGDMARLRVLTLDRNGLGFIYPKAFDSLSNLSSLSLSHNSLHLLPDSVFANLGRLVVLRLQDNRLEHSWSMTFKGLRSLHALHLSRNRLSSLRGVVFGDSPALRHLFLGGNLLKTLGQCVLPRQPRLKTLELTGNPIKCDCKLVWMRSLLRKNLELSVTGSCTGQLVSVVSSVLDMATDRPKGGCTPPTPVQQCNS